MGRPFSLLTAYQFLTLLNSKLRFHFLDQQFKLLLALFLAVGIHIPCDTLAIDHRRISPFQHVLTNPAYQTCSTLTTLELTGLKFHRFRLVHAVRVVLPLTVFSSSHEASEAVTSAPMTVPITSSIFLATSRFICSKLCTYTFRGYTLSCPMVLAKVLASIS